jgi:hypothetical protein
MTVLDRPSAIAAPHKTIERTVRQAHDEMRCVVCHKPFDFKAGQSAIVLKHIAYGYDFAHPGVCEATAREWIFVEPDYDRPAFSSDGERVRVLRIADAAGWAAVLPSAPEQVLAGTPVHYEPVTFWALVEYRDGSRHLEGVVREQPWVDEPGGAEFPEARRGRYTSRGYVQKMDF